MTEDKKQRMSLRPITGITLVSLLVCGLFYPFLITGIGQAFFPSQANGEIIQLNGKPIGSVLIAQSFILPIFFHPRNETASPSASGVDPDILPTDAYAQIPAISNATGIPQSDLANIVNQNQEGAWWVFGAPYVNALRLNVELIKDYPSVYSQFQG